MGRQPLLPPPAARPTHRPALAPPNRAVHVSLKFKREKHAVSVPSDTPLIDIFYTASRHFYGSKRTTGTLAERKPAGIAISHHTIAMERDPKLTLKDSGFTDGMELRMVA